MIVAFFLIVFAVFVFYKWSTKTFDYFEKQGFPFRKPVPLFGTNLNIITKRKCFTDSLTDWYNEFPYERASGLFEFRVPVVLIRDPKLVKQLAVKDFDYFMDHRSFVGDNKKEMFGKTLLALKGEKWRDMRATLSPAFTGSKMRQMFEFVNEVGRQTADAMMTEVNTGKKESFNVKTFATKFTVDVIASCAFGIEIDSFKNPGNDFHRIANIITNFASFKMGLRIVGIMAFPKIMDLFNVSLLDQECSNFFQQAITETMKTRKHEGIIRHDMINLLLQAQNGQLAHNKSEEKKNVDGFATVQESDVGKSKVTRAWEDDELAAQCFIFFIAGYNTISETMIFMAYELVCNPEIQEKLYNEIKTMHDKLRGKAVNYEQLQGLKYLDQVISETLRKWPVAIQTERLCVKEYDLKYDNKTLNIKPGVSLVFPIWSFHHDVKFFPEPENFNPDRFSEENRGNIDPDTFLPFGIGPRNCIGSRFALMELKTIFYHLLLNFSFEATEKTQIPLKFMKLPFGVIPEKGIWIAFKSRAA